MKSKVILIVSFILTLLLLPSYSLGQTNIYNESFDNPDYDGSDDTPVASLPEYFDAAGSVASWGVVTDFSNQTADCYPRNGDSDLDWEVYVAATNIDCGGGYYEYRDGMSNIMTVLVGDIIEDEGITFENISNIIVDFGLRADIDSGDELKVTLEGVENQEQIVFGEGEGTIGQTEETLEINPQGYYANLKFEFTSDDPWGDGSQAEGVYIDDLSISIEQSVPPVVENPIPDQNMIEGEVYTIDISNNFSDPNGDDDEITYSANSENEYIVEASANNENESIFLNAKTWVNSTSVSVTATDQEGGEVSTNFEVDVEENQPPVVVQPFEDPKTIANGEVFSKDLDNVFENPEDGGEHIDPLIYSVSVDDSDYEGTIATAEIVGPPNEESTLEVTGENVGEAEITVTAEDNVNFNNEEFTLVVSSVTSPEISVTEPVGGEAWEVGTTHDIEWNSEDLQGSPVDIKLLQNGDPVTTIESGIEDDGNYDWTISEDRSAGSGYVVRVTATDVNASDESGAFELTSAPDPQITVNTPSGGENWQVGTTQAIEWTRQNLQGSPVDIQLRQNGEPVTTIASEVSGDQESYDWSISEDRSPGTGYTVFVEATEANASGESGSFELTSDGDQTEIALGEPVGNLSGDEDSQTNFLLPESEFPSSSQLARAARQVRDNGPSASAVRMVGSSETNRSGTPLPIVQQLSGGSFGNSSGQQGTVVKLESQSSLDLLRFQISGGSGDADLYVRFGEPPTLDEYDCRPYNVGNDETCEFSGPSVGDWYVMIHGYNAYSGVTLLAEGEQDGGQPDLVSTSVMPQEGSVEPGGDLDVDVEVENQGDATASSGWDFELHLSTDQQLDGGDELIETTQWTTDLQPGDSQGNLVQTSVPSDLSGGTYYAIVDLDVNDEVNESDDGNNQTTSSSTVEVDGGGGPDPVIDVSPMELTASLAPGETSDQTLAVSNTGDSDLEFDVSIAGSNAPSTTAPGEVAAPFSGNISTSTMDATSTAGEPYDGQSTEVVQTATTYQVDDGTSENGLGLTDGGDLMWLNAFQVVEGAGTVTQISSAWGGANGSGLPTDKPVSFLVYEDPNDDGDPSDAVLLEQVTTEVQDPHTDEFTTESLSPTQVEGTFFVAALYEDQEADTFPAPMDESSEYQGASWAVGNTNNDINIEDLAANDVEPGNLDDLGYPANWLLRAEGGTGSSFVSVSPTSGTVPPDESQDLTAEFDAEGLEPGSIQEATINIGSNDEDQDPLPVPVTLDVTSDTAPQITVTNPSGGETWEIGTTHTIEWTSQDLQGSPVDIELLQDGNLVTTLESEATDDGSYEWTISEDRSAGTGYTVFVEATEVNAAGESESFELTEAPTPQITVNVPSGGETWQIGTTHTIEWTSQDLQGSPVDIELLQDGNLVTTLESEATDDGSYEWTISEDRSAGTGYTVFVEATQVNASDESNSFMVSQGQTVSFDLSDETVGTGQTATVDLSVGGFENVTSAQFTVNWDPSVASFSSVGDFNLRGLSGGDFGTPEDSEISDGTLTMVWSDPEATGVTLEDGTVVFSVELSAVGSARDSTGVVFGDDPTSREVTVNFSSASFDGNGGAVSILDVLSISGGIDYYNDDSPPVPDVGLQLEGDETVTDSTGGDGTYTFEEVNPGSYTLTPSRGTSDPSRGISALDLVLIQRDILGLQPLGGPYRQLAADVNGSSSVTALDIVLAQRVILGLSSSVPNGFWRFVPSSHSFDDPSDPFGAPASRSYSDLSESITGQDFVASKRGDVNGSWTEETSTGTPAAKATASGGRNATGEADVQLKIEDQTRASGDTIRVPVRADAFDDVAALQFTLQWSAERLTLVGTEGYQLPGLRNQNVGLSHADRGKLPVVWSDPEGRSRSLEDEAPIMTLQFRVEESGPVSVGFGSEPTAGRAYGGESIQRKSFSGTSGTIHVRETPRSYELKANYPNPSHQSTTFEYAIPKAGEVSLEVYDLLGRKVATPLRGRRQPGRHSVTVDVDDLPGGMYIVRFRAGSFSTTQKMAVAR
jgi:hypothetical protein